MPGKPLNSQARELVLNVLEYFELEKRNGGPLEPLSCVQERVAAALKISRRTVYAIRKRKENNQILSSPGKSRTRSKAKTTDLPEGAKMAVRNTLYDMYQQSNPTENRNVNDNYQFFPNSLEKPVQESQEYVPSQSVGAAVIPNYPPPAIPVNAAASNVPGNGNAIFLGSGSIGVVHLGGGAYVLGSGGLGYSETRRNPRPSIRSSTLPPIQAHPNLLPAAVNSQRPSEQSPIFSYTYPTGQEFPVDANGYEYLSPNRVGFGEPLPPRPLKITNTYAVPTSLQLSPPAPPPHAQLISHTTQYSPPQTLSPPENNQNFLPIYPKQVSNLYQSSYLK